MPIPVDVDDLIARAREGQPRAVARLLSLVEDASPHLREIARTLTPYTGRARIIGLTGPPGAGKSTSTAMLLSALRAQGKRVAVLAIDPSSPFSGGALLGDRIRMGEHATDPGVFIRSMATRGHLGGLAWATPQSARVLDAVGFDVVLIETVGVGQSEVDVVQLADSTVVLLAPGMGDGVQAAKAGVLEIADIFVVNKADRDGADATIRELTDMLSASRREITGPSWRQPIVRTVASRGEGGDDVLDALARHHSWLLDTGELAGRRNERARAEVEAIALRQVQAEFAGLHGGEAVRLLGKRVADGELDPYAAADELVAGLRR
ncbi:methylmalonyl Co-A mutase-associated GTPase MeaB [Haloechinothrix sp. YIM 98757]|uniref:Methylmalonyl Co-A mutase-associated GTPase MeaB n=1 Tax=Haloechinothrix aidingensis TaxID=2752311 RepID=A0A838A7A2_9PSEU|nr:methylmalonyl Co-A mutase-associated GTPase MeaB [Haloechinothrix aidingensis]